MCKWAGPIIDLLLEHVGHVQLCSKLTELLDSREEWLAVKRKSCEYQTKSYHLLISSYISSCKHVSVILFLFHFLTCAYNTYVFFKYASDSALYLSFLYTVSPRPLLHLCRLRIRIQMGRHRLKSLTCLPLPDRVIQYLSLAD